MAAGLLILFSASAAGGAQDGDSDDCYPDGCPTSSTTEPPDDSVNCGISVRAGQIGAEVEVTVTNVPAGGTVRILVDGDEVARGTNDAGAQSIRAMPMQTADLSMTFAVPDLAPGDYSIAAVGATFTVTCGGGLLSVLGSSDSRGGSDGLAFTGASILMLALVALALLAIGYVLVRRSRRRRTLEV